MFEILCIKIYDKQVTVVSRFDMSVRLLTQQDKIRLIDLTPFLTQLLNKVKKYFYPYKPLLNSFFSVVFTRKSKVVPMAVAEIPL